MSPRLPLSHVVLMFIRDHPGVTHAGLEAHATPWAAPFRLVITKPPAALALLLARFDFTQPLDARIRSEANALANLGLAQYDSATGTFTITDLGRAELQRLGV